MSITQAQLQWALQQNSRTAAATPATIGRLGERTLHAVLKSCCEPDVRLHEQKVGSYVADIVRQNEIIEVQTGSLYPLRRKLPVFLQQSPVRIVHPLAVQKRVWWVEPETGVLTGGRKSPRPQRPVDILPELFWVLPWFDPDAAGRGQPEVPGSPEPPPAFPLTVELVLLSMQEYRLRDGYANEGKKGAHRCNRLPEEVLGTVYLHSAADVAALLPPLPAAFTTAQLNRALRFSRLRAGAAKQVLLTLDILRPTGQKQNRAALFCLSPTYRTAQAAGITGV